MFHKLTKARIVVTLSLVTIVVGIGAYALLHSQAASSPAGADPLYRTIGAYGVLRAGDVGAIHALGFTTAISNGTVAGAWESTFSRNDVRYLDSAPKDMLYGAYRRACGTNVSCVMTPAQSQVLDSQIQKYVQAKKTDPNILGYYILDDSPGDVHDALVGVTRTINRYGAASTGGSRPTYCVFGATLDYKYLPTAARFTPNHSFFDKQISNYSPQGCDNVMVYAYATTAYSATYTNVGDGNYDWKMSNLLPYIYQALKQRGWNANVSKLTAVPQAFGAPYRFPTPSANAITTQVEAFCDAGWGGIMGFSWEPPEASGSQAMNNNASIVDGFRAGARRCFEDWGGSRPSGR